MPNPVIQSYLNDTSIPVDKRKKLLDSLSSGQADENDVALKISQKYSGKYGGGQPSQVSPAPSQMPQSSPDQGNGFMNFLGGVANVGKGIANFGMQAGGEFAKSIPNAVQGVTDFIGKNSPGYQLQQKFAKSNPSFQPWQLGDAIRPATDFLSKAISTGQDAAADTYGQDRQGLNSTLGKITGEVAGAVVGGNKAQQLFGKVGAGASNLGKLANFGLKSLAGTEGATLASQSRTATANEAGLGLGVDAGIGGLASALKFLGPKAGDLLYRFGTKLKGSGIDKTEDLVKKAQELALRGSRPQILAKAENIITTAGKERQAILEATKKTWNINDIVAPALEKAVAKEGARNAGVANAMVDEISNVVNTGNANLSGIDLLKLRQEGQQILRNELAGGNLDKLQQAKKLVWEQIYKEAGKGLDSVSLRIKKLNQNMEAAFAVKEPIEKYLNKAPDIGQWEGILQKFLRLPIATTNAAAVLNKAGSINPLLTSGVPKSLLLSLFGNSQRNKKL